MAGGQEKWYFTKEQLQNSPSRKCGLDADKELAYRQQAANLIQDMGQRLQVSQLCINTAIVYMHRFYAFHSFTQFHRNAIAAAALFLAAKVEEQPRKLEYVIKVAHVCLHRGEGVSALTPEQYQEQAQDLVFNENVLLQTLGFDVAIDHPHTHVVRTCHLVKAPKDLAQTSYFMASNSLHLTTMCLQYRPTVVACFCIHLASKWSNWAIPQSNEGRHWFSYVDRSVTMDLLEKLTAEFLLIFEKCPSRLKRKMMNCRAADGSSPHSGGGHPSGQAAGTSSGKHPAPPSADDFDKSFDKEYERERRRQPAPGGYVPASGAPPAPQPQKIDYNLYREKREREERERRQQAALQRGARPHARPPPHAHHPPAKHHAWPPHKPHHKPAHDHRHHRPPAHPAAPPTAAASTAPSPAPPPSAAAAAAVAPAAPAGEAPPPQRTRPPSLFSPENATAPAAAAAAPRRPPPAAPPARLKPPPEAPRAPSPKKQRPDPSAAIREMQPPAILSPFSTPPAKPAMVSPFPSPPARESKPRPRPPSGSEPELVPVVKKLEETAQYERAARGKERRAEPPRLNGIETDPTLVSNLLKESLAKPAPITAPADRPEPAPERRDPPEPPPHQPPPAPPARPEPPPAQPAPPAPAPPTDDTDHKHKKEKKKKDKHKHKDRDKSKEERKKHKKDKDKEKKREGSGSAGAGAGGAPGASGAGEGVDGALRITIPREKLAASPGLKIKIPKERLAAPPPPPAAHQHPAGLKIKISKEVLESSRKRSMAPGAGAPPPKQPRPNGAAPPHKVETPMGNGHSGK